MQDKYLISFQLSNYNEIKLDQSYLSNIVEVLKSRIVDDLDRLEQRIECDEDGIEFEVEVEDDVEYLYANITYRIIKYNTYYTSKIKVGEVGNEQKTNTQY